VLSVFSFHAGFYSGPTGKKDSCEERGRAESAMEESLRWGLPDHWGWNRSRDAKHWGGGNNWGNDFRGRHSLPEGWICNNGKNAA